MKIKNIITETLACLSFIFIIWFLFSWFEVITQNTNPDPTYHAWNIFSIYGWLIHSL